jgi:hypothetical protein
LHVNPLGCCGDFYPGRAKVRPENPEVITSNRQNFTENGKTDVMEKKFTFYFQFLLRRFPRAIPGYLLL